MFPFSFTCAENLNLAMHKIRTERRGNTSIRNPVVLVV